MKKILIILNESHIPQHVIQTAIHIAKESNSLLEAVFLNDMSSLNIGYPFPNDMFLTGEDLTSETRTEENMHLMQSEAQVFRDSCEECGIGYKIELDKTISIKHLIHLSSFADLMIADAGANTEVYSLTDILADAHCPLLLTPKKAMPAEKIFLAYDGSYSGMYAIKMFSYLFPEWKDLPAQLIHIAPEKITEIPQILEIKSWASKHFSNLNFEVLHGNTRKELVAHLYPGSEKAIVVMGAYSGSAVTRLFHKSMADSVIHGTQASLFISHE